MLHAIILPCRHEFKRLSAQNGKNKGEPLKPHPVSGISLCIAYSI